MSATPIACVLIVASSIAFAQPKYELKGHELVVPFPIVYEIGKDTVKPESRVREGARRQGADCKRLVPVGFGETKPIADNRTADGRAKNRRTNLFNAALRGKSISNAPVDGGGKIADDPCN